MKIRLTEKESEELREIFPAGYAKTISTKLNLAGLQPQKAKKYNSKIIRDVLTGRQSDFNVLLELFRYKDEILTKEQELKKLRNKNYNPAEDTATNILKENG